MEKTQVLYLIHQNNRLGLLFLLTLVFNLTFQTTQSQEVSETGLPYIQNYSPNDYGAFDQNWGIVQDSLGIMYFANGDGVLSYNGANWSLIELPNKSTVFSLGIAASGKMYVGALDELGYLEANKKGELCYVSLLSELSKEYHGFSKINTICPTKDGVLFVSKKYIFKWDGEKFKVQDNLGDTAIFYVNDILFQRIIGKGLMQLKNNIRTPLPMGELFADDQIFSILPYRKNEILIATRNQLFIFNGKSIDHLKTNITSFFKDNIIYKGVLRPKSNGSSTHVIQGFY